MKPDFKRILVLFIILAPVSLLFTLLTKQPVTLTQFISLAIVIIMVDLLFILVERRKK